MSPGMPFDGHLRVKGTEERKAKNNVEKIN